MLYTILRFNVMHFYILYTGTTTIFLSFFFELLIVHDIQDRQHAIKEVSIFV